MIGRRGFITGLVSFVAAPAIVRAGSLMPVKTMLIAPDMTAAQLHFAEMLVHPPLMDLFDFDVCIAEMAQIMAVPAEWLAPR